MRLKVYYSSKLQCKVTGVAPAVSCVITDNSGDIVESCELSDQ
jgi:hypothetical protein